MAKKYWWEEDEKKTDNKSGDQSSSQSGNQYWWDDGTIAKTIGSNVSDRVNKWFEDHSSYISEFQNRYSGRKGNYEDAYVGDSADWVEKVKNKNSYFDTEYNSILAYLDQYSDYLDAGWVLDVKTNLLKAKSDQNRVLNASISDNMHWKTFETEDLLKEYGSPEDAYKASQREVGYINSYTGKTSSELTDIMAGLEDGEEKDWVTSYRSSVDHEEKKKFDLVAGQEELDRLLRADKEMSEVSQLYFSVQNGVGEFTQEERDDIVARYQILTRNFGSPTELSETIAEKRAYLGQAKRIQEGIKLAGVADPNSEYYDPEFSKYAYYNGGENIALSFDYADAISGASDKLINLQYMNDDEKAIYRYYYNKHGYEAANEYYYSIEEALNARQGKELFGYLENNAPLEIAFSIAAGLEQFGSGIKNLFDGEDYIPTSAIQYASGMVREDLKDVDLKYYNFSEGQWDDANIFGSSLGQGIYDLGTTTFNMAPSILASVAANYVVPGSGAAVGGILMGGSAAGNAYQTVLNQGYGKAEARLYSTAIGISEATLQYFLGGIGSLGGTSSKITQAVAGIDNGILRFALQYGGQMASEGLEEGLQEILDPILQNAILGADEDVNWSEVAYSALLGGLSAGLLDGGSAAVNNVAKIPGYISTGNTIRSADGGVDALRKLANDVAGVSTDANMKKTLNKQAGKVSSEVATGNKLVAGVKNANNAMKVGKLYETVNTANNLANATANQADIAKSLQRNNFDAETANAIAEALVAKYNGQELTKAQVKLLKSVENSTAVKNAISNIMANEQSTMGQRSQNIRSFERDISKGVFSKEINELVKSTTEKQFAPAGDYTVSKDGKATAMVTEVVDGKTITKDTGEVIDIKGVASIRKGEMLLDIGDGKTINAKNVAYANKNDALIYESVANLGDNINAETANKLIGKYKGGDALVFARGMAQAYTYGFYGLDKSELTGKRSLTTELTEEQRNFAYGLGLQYRPIKDANDKTTAIKKLAKSGKTPSERGVYYRDKDGKATDISTYLKESNVQLNDLQKTGIEAMRKMSEMMGVRFNVFESWVENGKSYYLDADGDVVEGNPNGFYDTTTGEVYIDLNAGNDYQGTMLFTIAHELTHFMRQWSPEHFTKISKIVFQHGGMKGNVSELVALKQAKAEAKGKPISYDVAMEEVVADSMETILKDGKVVEFMADVKKKDYTAWKKLKGWFKNLAKFLRKMVWAYSSQSAQTTEGAKVAEFSQDILSQIERIFAEGIIESSENYHRAEIIVGQINIFLDEIMELDTVATIDSSNATPYAKDLKEDEASGLKVFKEQGGAAVRPGFGRVVLGRKGVVHTAFHGNGPAKQAAFPAVKAVIENGIEIGRDINHKGRGYDTVTFAAPIDFFQTKAPLGVVVKVFENGRGDKSFYIHEICDAEGNYIELVDGVPTKKEISNTGEVDSSSTADVADDGNNPNTSIHNDSEIVKSESVEAMDIEVDAKTESVAPTVLNSERTWTESDYVQEREQAAKDIAKAIGVSVKKAKAYIDSVNSIAKMIAEDRVRLDYFSSPNRSSFVGNVEYGGSFDFSTLCKKRRLLTGTFTAIQKALPNTALTADEILDIRNRMKDAGLEVSCGLCYVEGSRANMGQFAKEFLKLYKQYNPDAWQPNMADVNTPDGIEWVRINHPECYEQYEYFWNHYGTLKPGDKNLFASQQKPKLYQLHTEYKGEVLDKFNNDDNVEAKNLNGGIRLQSFSDFEIVHLIDTMQIIMDMSRVGLAGQAYTKVPDFAWALGDTGLKINLSLIAKGVDENGKLIFDDVEGMPIAEATKLRDRYSKNVGTILVAFNDEQLLAAMADERVDYIIPFHRSQWKKSQYGAMGLPAKTKDYTYMQNEKFIKPQYHEYRGRMVQDKATNYMPNEYWDFSKSGKENAEAYLEMCARNNKRPKFYKLLQNNGDGSYSLKSDGSTDGYWKLLIDFKMYDNDGVGSPQMPVTPEFNMDEAQRMLNDYQGGHSNFPVAQGIVDDFVNEYKDNHKGALYSDRDSDVDRNYMDAVNRGDMDTVQKMVDAAAKAAGYVARVFHGTKQFGFTKFDTSFSDDKISVFATPSNDLARSYSGVGGKRAISDKSATVNSEEYVAENKKMQEKLQSKIDNFASEVDKYFGKKGFVKTDDIAEVMNQYAEAVNKGKMSESRAEQKVEKHIQKILKDGYDASLHDGESFKSWEQSDDYSKLMYKAQSAFTTAMWVAKNTNRLRNAGNYDLYANTEGLLEIDGNGANWNELQSNILPSATSEEYKKYNRNGNGKWTTRSVAKYALDHGYKGVCYKNILDVGGTLHDFDALSNPTDVYAFFSPESQLKSADPVTYDKKGKVIPLSERFNAKNKDVRYSDRDTTSATDIIDSLYNYNTVNLDKAVVNFNLEHFKEQWEKGYYSSVVDTIAKQTGKSKQEVWNAFAGVLMKNEGIAKVDGKTYINVHELNEDNLRKAFELGGLAAPSIGIVDVDNPVTHFGDIALIFPDIFSPETNPTYYGDSYSSSFPAVGRFTDSTILEDALTNGFEGMEWGGILSQEEIYDLVDELDQVYFYDGSQRTSHSISNDGFANANEFARNYNIKSIPGLQKLYDGLRERYDSYEQFLEDFAEKAFTNKRMHRTYTGNSDFDFDARRYLFKDYNLENVVGEMTADGDKDFRMSLGEKVTSSDELLSNGMRARLKAGRDSFYEVKPQRAVYINEATYAAVPDNTSADVIGMLEYEGVKVVKYQRKEGYNGIAGGRAEAIKGILESDTTGVRYQDRAGESVSNRSLLANAFEGLAQNDIEKNKIQEYKGKIDLINSEEQKLSELNQKIKELSFAKGVRDTKKIRDLQFEARQTANRINTYDKQLLRLEASKPLQDVLAREKKLAYEKAEKRGKEALDKYKERTAKTQREMLERWQDSRKKGIESRNKTAMRHKIKDVVNELNQYLLKGTKDRHVPESLQKAVAEALNAVNMDTVGAEERIAKLKDEMMKAKTPEQIQEISRKIDHISEMGDRMNGRLKNLKDAYDELLKSPDENTRSAYDEVIHNKLDSVIDKIGNTPIRDMTLAQLEDVYDMYRMVLKSIRDVNKSFKDAKNQSISTRANAVMAQVEEVGGKHKLSAKMLNGVKKFGWNNLKPVYAFEHIGSVTLKEAFKNVRAGEDVWAKDVTEARGYYLDKAKKYNYDSWDFQKQYDFKSTSEMDFSLNLEQIMSLYAYSKRDQAADHLKYGGIVFDESTEITIKTKLGIPVKFNPTEATAYNISPETLAEITSKLTDEQKDFVDEMQDYLSTVMGAKGNEVSMAMYDIKLFKDKNYFPLKSAQQFMEKAREQQKGDVKIKNSGFSKETVPKAKNPIVLTPFMNVWANHVNDMSMYHAFVLPLEDFYRIYNYKTPSKDETLATEGVNQYIQNAYGRAATAYIDQLLKDLNGGARTDTTTGFINKMMGLFKKGSVFASMSVVIQQPSAMARAAALVDTKYFIGPKVDHKRHKALWNEVKQYAPVAIIKEMGYFDTNMGKSTQDFILSKEYSSFSEKMKALVTDSNFRDEVLSKAPALADEIAWCGIWEAVKRETQAKNPNMDVKSEAFLKMAGERFTEVVVKTQVYDSVLSRSAMMRSKDTGMKMATAFMAEPTTSINMIADALLQGKRGNKKYARTAIGAVIASQIFNSILVSFVYAGRDDDDDETYLEKYIGTLTGEMIDSLNPATYIPFVKDIVSIVQGYDVERSDMAVISDLWKAWENLSSDNMSAYQKVENFAGSIAQIFGLPVKNIMRDVRAIYQTVDSFVNGQQTTSAGIGYAVKSALPEWIGGGDVANKDQLYEAYLSGDAEQIARVQGRFKDQSAVNTAMRSAIKERFESGDIDYNTAEEYLVEFGGLDDDDAYWKVEEWKYEMESGEDFHKFDDFYTAVKTGKNLKAVIKKYTDNGVDEKTLASQITSYYKPLYKEMSNTERAAIKGYLLNAYQLLGYNRTQKSKDIDKWLKD